MSSFVYETIAGLGADEDEAISLVKQAILSFWGDGCQLRNMDDVIEVLGESDIPGDIVIHFKQEYEECLHGYIRGYLDRVRYENQKPDKKVVLEESSDVGDTPIFVSESLQPLGGKSFLDWITSVINNPDIWENITSQVSRDDLSVLECFKAGKASISINDLLAIANRLLTNIKILESIAWDILKTVEEDICKHENTKSECMKRIRKVFKMCGMHIPLLDAKRLFDNIIN